MIMDILETVDKYLPWCVTKIVTTITKFVTLSEDLVLIVLTS